LGAADLLRRAMGKKIRAEMEAQREIFVRGATERGITDEKATEVFDLMAKFADYGFNKSHAAAYALVAYQTAWMKANHPEVFIAACMSLALGNTDRLAALKQEAERASIRILPPDINRSGADFSVERGETGKLAIRYALAAIKKVGLAAMQAVVAARGDRPFAGLAEFASRVDPRQLNRMQIEHLVKAGAFDSMDSNRARLFAAAETILRRAVAEAEERDSGQIGLFGGGASQPEPLRLPSMPDWPQLERLAFEAEAIGFHLTAHPLDAYAQALRRLGVIPCAQVEARAQAGAARVRLAGNVVAIKERITRTGSRMAWVRLSDASGSCEVTLFSEVLARARELVADGTNLLVTADLRQEGEALRVTAQDVVLLDQAAATAGAAMKIWLRETAAVPHIRDLLGTAGSGKGRVVLVPKLGAQQSVEIALPGGFNVTPRLAQALKLLPGVDQVEEV
ncbi:MAG TPA: OB-fold nucleic acid binding domain-containing protein, partial [Acetobacteraceae bacterium]|nr:OB-fold nucleic acid binding domain-containing protein [Acetobacteraceae bacterium]